MKPYTLCYYSATAMEIPSLSRGVSLYQQNGGEIRVIARTMSQLFDESRKQAFVRDALAADIIILTLHGGKASCPAFDALLEALDAAGQQGRAMPYFHIQPVGGDEDALFLAQEHSDGFGEERWDTINAYIAHGGHLNFQHLLSYLYTLLFQESIEVEPPLKLPHEGIYHPDIPGIPDIEDYVARHLDPHKPTVGLWFYQTYWLNHNLAYIDAIIREIEYQGANVIPVFHLRYPDELLGNHGADYRDVFRADAVIHVGKHGSLEWLPGKALGLSEACYPDLAFQDLPNVYPYPKWLEGLKRHGYKGAGDISKMMDVVFGWDATAQVIDDWMYTRMAQKYALDPEMQAWLKSVNPYALQNILDKLLEAIGRGMWQADEAIEHDLRDAYLDIEGEIEEITE